MNNNNNKSENNYIISLINSFEINIEKKGLGAHHKNQGLNKNKNIKKMESKFKI